MRPPAPGSECRACGYVRFEHAPGCGRRPVLDVVPASTRLEWWVRVDGVRIGLVTAHGPRGGRSYVAVTERGERVPAGRVDALWSRGHAVNALVRAEAEREEAAGVPLVNLDAYAPEQVRAGYGDRGHAW